MSETVNRDAGDASMRRRVLRLRFRRRPRHAEGSLESWLNGSDTSKHLLADEVLKHLGRENELAFLAKTITAEEKDRKRRGVRNGCVILGGWIGFQALFAISTHHSGHHGFSFGGMIGPFANQLFTGAKPSKLHQQCVGRLSIEDDLRIFPYLVDALICPIPIAAVPVAQRLTKMLPTLDAEDFAILTKAQRTSFFRYINPNAWNGKKLDSETRHALSRQLLIACGRMGDTEAIAPTKKLVKSKAKSPEIEAVQMTARNCLPLLERAKVEQATEQRLVARR